MITNKMDVNFDVLGASVCNRITSKSSNTEIVTLSNGRGIKQNGELSKQIFDPCEFTCNMSKSLIFDSVLE